MAGNFGLAMLALLAAAAGQRHGDTGLPQLDLPPVQPLPAPQPLPPGLPGAGPPTAAPPNFGPPAPAGPTCAPAKLFMAVVRDISPGLLAADPHAQPRQIWRQGATLLRSEEDPDPVRGGQPLYIVSEPDVWIVDEATRKGAHRKDPGPVFEVRAPILPTTGTDPELLGLEFGCEAEWVARMAPTEQRVVPFGTVQAALHTLVRGDQMVAILMDRRRNTPILVSYLRQGKPVLVLRYDTYRQGLSDRPELFQPPPRAEIVEATPPPATPASE